MCKLPLMKKIPLLLLLVTQILAIDLPWIHSIDEAKKIAQKEHKDIYVFIGAEHCNFCVRYKNEVLSDKKVQQTLQNYVKVFLNRDKHKVPSYFEKFGVPRHYFLKPDGTIYYDDAGIKGVNGFFLMIDEAGLNR